MTDPLPACTHEYIFKSGFSTDYQCSTIANSLCLPSVEILNFYDLHFCKLNANPYIFLLILFLFIIVIFRYITNTVEEYIAPGVLDISKKIGLTESVSAVTLVAFSSGAGELITSLVAGDMEGGMSYNIGHIFGSG